MRSVFLRGAVVAGFWIAGAGLGMGQTGPNNPQPPENTVTAPTPSQAGQDPSMAKPPGSDAAPGAPPQVVDPESTSNLAPDEQPVNNAKPRIAGQKVPSAEHDAAAHNDSVAQHDAQPTITHTFNFTKEQKHTLLTALAEDKSSAAGKLDLQEATVLPIGLELKPVPEIVSKEMPWVGRYKYIKSGNQVALVEPNLRYVAIILR